MDTIYNSPILGIDEVGRGALAGPVYLGGVLLTENFPLLTYHHSENPAAFQVCENLKIVRDSKKLTAKTREQIHDTILEAKLPYLVLSASNQLIDNFGIGVCLSHLVSLIIAVIAANNDHSQVTVIIDGKIKLLNLFNLSLLQNLILENNLPANTLTVPTLIINSSDLPSNLQSLTIIRENKADDKYLSIALASNLAKVQRDRLMTELDKICPEYDWATNKGYGTLKHRQAIAQNPEIQYLRQSFLGNILKI